MTSYRLLPHVQLVLVRVPGVGDDYRVDYHYLNGPVGAKGPVIPWLSDLQREQFLREGLVEEIPDGDLSSDDEAASSPRDSETTQSAVDDCLGALERLNVAGDSGAPACRTALREAGFRFGNDIVAAAVRHRKQLSGTVS